MNTCATCADDKCPNRQPNRYDPCEDWTHERPPNGTPIDPFDRIDAELRAVNERLGAVAAMVTDLTDQCDRFGALFMEARRDDER